jgi:hypothetical protein
MLAVAVGEILAGKTPKKSKHGFQYGYALEVITQHFGTRIDEDELGLGCNEAIDSYFKKAKKPSFEKLTKEGVFPLAIPAPADFPGIGTMNAADIDACLAALDAIAPLAKDDDDATEIADALRSWCGKAKKKKLGMVWFYY